MNDPTDEPRRGFRWQALLHGAAQPVFVLDRRRRLLFVNPAFEAAVGLTLDEARGLPCRRPRSPGPDAVPEDAVAYLLTPPTEALAGSSARVRRLHADRQKRSAWYDVEFLPVRQDDGHVLVGRLAAVPMEAHPTVMLPERLVALRRRAAERFGFASLQSGCSAMERLTRQVRLALQLSCPVLIVGERGAGKQTVARVIHHQGRDAERAFAAIDCERLPADTLATLLVTAVPTGVGTVYLRHASALPREVQASLCGRSHDGPRIIAGVSASADELVRGGSLLREFADVLSPLTLDVPPLRHRLDDLPALAEQLLTRAAGGPLPLTPAALEVLRGHAWPGNVAELFAVLLDSRPRATQGRIDAEHLPAQLRLSDRLSLEAPRPPAPTPLPQMLEQVERRLIEVALRRARGNRAKAAEALGIYRSLLARRMKALGLEAEGE